MSRRRTHRKSYLENPKLWLWSFGVIVLYTFITSLPDWIIVTLLSFAFIGGAAYVYFLFTKQTQYRNGMLRLTIDEVDTMTGVEFERYAEILFQNLGYSIQKTAVTGDFGVDLVISKDGIKTAVQCKRYSSTIGVVAIQQAHTGMAYYRCQRSLVMTNSTFTKAAISLAESSRCILVDRSMLAGMLRGIDPVSGKTIQPAALPTLAR